MRTIIFALALLTALAANCENYIKAGTKWVCRESGEFVTRTIDEYTDNYYEKHLGLFLVDPNTGNKVLEGKITTVGDKVIYEIKKGTMALIYDFDMKPGEGKYIYSCDFPVDQELYWYVYEEDVTLPDFEGLPIMKLTQRLSETTGSGDIVYWVKGMCSIHGLKANMAGEQLKYEIDYYQDRLIEVWDGDKLLFKHPRIQNPLSVAEVNADSPEVRIDGLQITVCGATDESATIYSQDGIAIARFDLNGEHTMTLPAPGVYILKAGVHSRKILAR